MFREAPNIYTRAEQLAREIQRERELAAANEFAETQRHSAMPVGTQPRYFQCGSN